MVCSSGRVTLFSSTVPPMSIESGNNGAVAEGGQIRLWCKFHSSNPAVTPLWKENGNSISSSTKHSVSTFYGTEVLSLIALPAERHRNGVVIKCIPEFDLDMLVDQTQEFLLNITCKWSIFIYLI